MPWQTGPMKDVAGCDKPRGAAKRALIRGCPNGETRPPSWVVTGFGRGVRREVKHLSTCRKGYSVSSGERKRIRPNRPRAIPVGGCAVGVAGRRVPEPTLRAAVIKPCARGTGLNAGPQRVMAPYLEAHGPSTLLPSSTGPVEPRANPSRP